MMKANKQHFYSNLSIFLHIMLLLVIFSFSFLISKSFAFILTIPIALLSIVFFVTLKKKKVSKNEDLVQEKMFKEKLQPPFDVGKTEFNQQSGIHENHEGQDGAKLGYSFPLDSESRNFLVMNKTFECNVHEQMQEDDLQSDSSLPSDSERSIILGATFEIDYNEYQNVSSCDGLDSDTDDGDGDYKYGKDNDDEQYCNIDSKESSLLTYTTSIYPISDEYEDEDGEDSLIEIHLPNGNFSNLAHESTQKMESELLDFLWESIFMQQNLMELLSETNDMNEDENLIEIDISM
ncbi:uncharacterized protein LOC131656503 [Vicia villosa]|uniref:uncharacterized protein LOC131656503 n=1 Tax=Vicia villosa TaxID=3911 RepID=UPI00273CBA3B|nr:uncharacterized protein LOC131656503 [Vicia villosa]